MFRYIIPLILANGKSKRFNKNKSTIKITNINFLEFNFLKLLKIGFSSPIINGEYENYKFINDDFKNLGPISYLINLNNKNFFNIFFLIITIDMLNISNNIIILILKKLNKYYSYYFKSNIFPIIKKTSLNNKNLIKNYINLNKLKNKNIKIIINNFLIKKKKIRLFFERNFININIIFNLKMNKKEILNNF